MRWLGLPALLLLASVAQAVTVDLAWDYDYTTSNPSKFIVYRQEGCTGAAIGFDVVVPTQTFSDVGPFISGTTYCYVVTAANDAGLESAPSNTVAFQVPEERPEAPSNLRGVVR